MYSPLQPSVYFILYSSYSILHTLYRPLQPSLLLITVGQAPSTEQLNSALGSLRSLHAVDDDARITALGSALSQLPLDLQLGESPAVCSKK